MKVSQLVTMLSNLDQEKEINFTFQVELGKSFKNSAFLLGNSIRVF